jgi:predicted ATPase
MLLKEIEFKKDHRCYQAGDKVFFNSNLTIITGDNGSGKSTLITCIRSLYKSKWSMSSSRDAHENLTQEADKDIEIGYLDCSQDLFKNSPEMDFENFGLYKKCMTSSSGQGSVLQLLNILDKHKNKPLIIVDEPERGLSIKWQNTVAKSLLNFSENNPDIQLIITTHSPKIMKMASKVYSTSHRGYLSSEQYFYDLENELI